MTTEYIREIVESNTATTPADELARSLTEALKSTNIQLCNYGRRYIVKKGCFIVAKGNSLYINGKGPAFLFGSFKAYTY